MAQEEGTARGPVVEDPIYTGCCKPFLLAIATSLGADLTRIADASSLMLRLAGSESPPLGLWATPTAPV